MAYWISTATYGSISGQGKSAIASPKSSIKRIVPSSEGILKSVKGRYDRNWGEKLAEYLEFQEKHGRAPLYNLRDNHEFRLAAWLSLQRGLSKKGELSNLRTVLLEENGIDLKIGKELATWHKKFACYLEFKKKHGREPKVTLKDADERELGIWYHDQFRLNKISKFSPEQRKLLEDNGFALEPKDRNLKWSKHLEDYLSFKERHGRLPSTCANDAEELRIARWRAGQAKNNGRWVSPERRKILEEAGILAPLPPGRKKIHEVT